MFPLNVVGCRVIFAVGKIDFEILRKTLTKRSGKTPHIFSLQASVTMLALPGSFQNQSKKQGAPWE